jgi:hypothetical protein
MMLVDRDVLLAVMQTDLSLAGLVLVFTGFILSKGESFSSRRGDKYQYLALCSFVTIGLAMVSAWACLDALESKQWDFIHPLVLFKTVLVATGLYVLVSGWMLRP